MEVIYISKNYRTCGKLGKIMKKIINTKMDP